MDSNLHRPLQLLQLLLALKSSRSNVQSCTYSTNSGAITALSTCLLIVCGIALTACNSSPGYAARAEGVAEPGVSQGAEPGVSAGSNTVVSSGPLDNQHEWTQEEMLLARAMPMSQEERDFSFKHKAPDSIRTWTFGEFQEYTNSPMGRTQLLQEGRRWVSIKNMLKEQLALGQDFLAGGGKAKPKKAKSNSSDVGNSQSEEPIPDFLIDEAVFQGGESATTFDHLKECRQDITDLCRSIDGVKKTALKRGRQEALEKYMNAQQ
ncbi:hypothetical protein BH11CYA1_BH11CYA1_14970 [soil metagenome]